MPPTPITSLEGKDKAVALAWGVGLRGQGCEKSLWRVLEGFRGKAIDCALKAKKKLLMWLWCVGLRGQGCSKSLWRVLVSSWGFWGVLEGIEGFEAWQTAGLNASKKLVMAP